MTKLHLHIGIYVLLTFLVCACTSPGPSSTPTNTRTYSPLPASTATPSYTSTLMPTLLPATGTLTPTVATLVTQAGLVPCNNVENPSSLHSRFPGTLIFKEVVKVAALDGASLKEREIIDFSALDDWLLLGLSPNGKWIGYTTYMPPEKWRDTTLHLLSATQDITTTLPANPGLPASAMGSPWFTGRWVNDELWLIASEEYLGLVNPFNGTWDQSLFSKLPNRYDQSGVAISPDLGMALFVQGTQEPERLVLINLQSGEQVWDDSTYLGGLPDFRTPYLVDAAWSKGSSMIEIPIEVIAERSVHLLVVDRKGRITVIRPTAPDNGSYGHSWSPDGRYLAFVGLLEKDPARRGIIIYDRFTNTSQDVCPIQDDATGSLETHSLVWSPDSQYLVFSMGSDTMYENNRILMLNIHTGEVTLLKHGPWITLIGWSADNAWVTP